MGLEISRLSSRQQASRRSRINASMSVPLARRDTRSRPTTTKARSPARTAPAGNATHPGRSIRLGSPLHKLLPQQHQLKARHPDSELLLLPRKAAQPREQDVARLPLRQGLENRQRCAPLSPKAVPLPAAEPKPQEVASSWLQTLHVHVKIWSDDDMVPSCDPASRSRRRSSPT